jgi:hypothetical protein
MRLEHTPYYWIVARNFVVYDDYIRNITKTQPKILEQRTFRYVNGVDSLRGHTEIRGSFYGLWYHRNDAKEIYEAILVSHRTVNIERYGAMLKARRLLDASKSVDTRGAY